MKQELLNQEIELAKEARNAYYKEYRKNNKEKIKKANQKYWLKRAKELKGEE